jgi:hypothetical protein
MLLFKKVSEVAWKVSNVVGLWYSLVLTTWVFLLWSQVFEVD